MRINAGPRCQAATCQMIRQLSKQGFLEELQEFHGRRKEMQFEGSSGTRFLIREENQSSIGR